MKILVVCQHFYPENFRINDICFELVKKGHDVTVLTGLPNYPKGKVFKEYRWFKNRNQVINGVKIKRCSLVGRGNSTIMMGINYLWFAFFGSLKALFMKKDFDLVYVFQISPITMAWPAILIKKIKKIPLIIHCLDQWPISVTIGPIKKGSLIYNIIYKISSKSFKNYFINELNISKKSKKLIYYPSYAESCYGNINFENNKVFDLVFAGNIGPAQSVETIIEAANILKNHKDIFFHIVGDGLSKKNCEDLAKKYKLKNIKFYGYFPVEEMPKFYNKADAFLITMVNNDVVNNTLPAKIQSYMLSGKPIIGAISGEVKNVVKDANCGLCCESLDYNELAKIILEAKNNSDMLKIWSKNSKNYYLKYFEKDKCINNLVKIMKKTIRDYNE